MSTEFIILIKKFIGNIFYFFDFLNADFLEIFWFSGNFFPLNKFLATFWFINILFVCSCSFFKETFHLDLQAITVRLTWTNASFYGHVSMAFAETP